MAKIWGDAGKSMTPMSFGKSFDRMQGQPLDKSAVITDTTFAAAYAKAETFAASDNAYVGMVLSVSDGTTTKFYGVVNEAGTLEEVGSNIELDTSLEVEGKAADAKAVGDAINQLSSEIAGGTVAIDKTLSEENKAAEAAATGEAITQLSNRIAGNETTLEQLSEEIAALATGQQLSSTHDDNGNVTISSASNTLNAIDDSEGNVIVNLT